ncbi:MAG: lytic transglycosylase domain-containing protein [Alphaproteobacteria bacterium]|nr:MAG: lytic transglycosylase domain-containing protein [Alphaproteobacteria bacterium]
MARPSPSSLAPQQSQRVAGYEIDGSVLQGIRKAAAKTGVDFGYLMAQAAQESSFQPEARAGTSSATGLYQFLDSTWLQMVRQHGSKYGLGDLAQQIRADGRVADPTVRQQILNLRRDPHLSAVLGAEFALGNKAHLEQALDRRATSADLYLAHFLGAGGATRFLRAVEQNGNTPAAALLPDAAQANRAVFYDRETGRPRTVREVYDRFARSIDAKSTQFAALAESPGQSSGAPRSPSVVRLGSVTGAPLAVPPGGGLSGDGNDAAGPTGAFLSILALAALDGFGSEEMKRALGLDGYNINGSKDDDKEKEKQKPVDKLV